jgi:hypothetical protein
MDVVVVLPCDPPIAMPYFMRMSSASISARPMTGIPAARAASSSGLSGFTALEYTTTCAPSMFEAACPANTRPPARTRRSVTSLVFWSEPDTW